MNLRRQASVLCKVTQARIWIHRRFLKEDWECIRIVAVFRWILKTWRFNKIWMICATRFWNKQRLKNSVFLTRVAIGSKPRSEVQTLPPFEEPSWPFCDSSIWKRRRNRLVSVKQRTGVYCAATQFRPSSSSKKINIKEGSERFGKEEFKEEDSSPTKKSRCDQGQPRETSWNEVKQKTLETRQLGEISSTAEKIKEKQKQWRLRSM